MILPVRVEDGKGSMLFFPSYRLPGKDLLKGIVRELSE
jgi:hypothetical protein